LAVYPNPVSSLLNVVYTEGSSFQILNLLGQQVLTGKTASQVDVSALPQGTYILKVGAEQAKFLKQ
jgi:Secretion system C-terminal sorting domain